MELNREALLEILKPKDGPLSQVENVVFGEPFQATSVQSGRRGVAKRGPKSASEWVTEMRNAWSQVDDEEKLVESWLAALPQVQRLAAYKYGGRSIGKGLALQELLKKAILEAQQYETDEKTREVLLIFPYMKAKEIAAKFGLRREHFSRKYSRNAARLVTRAFQHDSASQDKRYGGENSGQKGDPRW